MTFASFMYLLNGGDPAVNPSPPEFDTMTNADVVETLVNLAVAWADHPKRAGHPISVTGGAKYCACDYGEHVSLRTAAVIIWGTCSGPRPNVVGSGPGYLMPQPFTGSVREPGMGVFDPMADSRVLRAHQEALIKDMAILVAAGKPLCTEPFVLPTHTTPRVLLVPCPLEAHASPGEEWAPWQAQNGTKVYTTSKVFIPEGPLTLLDMQMIQSFMNACVGKAPISPHVISSPCFILAYSGELSAMALQAARVVVPWQVTLDGVQVVFPK